MRVDEITIPGEGYFCVTSDSILGLWGKNTTVRAERDPYHVWPYRIKVFTTAGIRADVTTHLAAEKVLRDVIALLPSSEQRQQDAIRAAAEVCREELCEWLGVNTVYLPHELRGYALILSILEDIEGE